MMSRRALLTAGVAGGLTSSVEASPVVAGEQPQSERESLDDIASGIASLERSFDEAWNSNAIVFGHAARVRTQFETYFRSTQRFPDFIDVGMGVFLDIYDWHIKNRQQLVITRGPDARYWMQFMFTTLILRGEQDAAYIGVPYDKV